MPASIFNPDGTDEEQALLDVVLRTLKGEPEPEKEPEELSDSPVDSEE